MTQTPANTTKGAPRLSAQRLQGRIAVVTGAGSGIGRAIALRFLAEGASVLAADRSADGLAETVALAVGDERARIVQTVMDLAADEAPNAIMSACQHAFGEPDLLVNNAGVGAAKALHDSTDEDLDRYLDINVRSLMRLSRAFIAFTGRKPTAIVNTASVFGLRGFVNSAPYSASKAAVIGLTRQMAADYGQRGLRVNAVAPGLIATPLTAERLESNPWYKATMVGATPLGRAGTPDDVAAAVAFLCSDDASFISGQTLAIDGGWSETKYWPASS